MITTAPSLRFSSPITAGGTSPLPVLLTWVTGTGGQVVTTNMFEGVGVRITYPSPTFQLWLSSWSVPRLITWIASHARRVSVSSTEENLDLEASLAAIRGAPGYSFPAPVPEQEEPRPQSSVSRSGTRNEGESSRSPTGAVRGLANRLRSSIASLGSPHSPVPGSGETIWTSKKNFATDTQLLFKRRITNLYVQVSALRSYVELNYSGFRKVLKK